MQNIFVPKYIFTTYLRLILNGGLFIFILLFNIINQNFSWEYVLVTIFLGVSTIFTARNIIKEIEFTDKEMIIRYFIKAEVFIAYDKIRNITPYVAIETEHLAIHTSTMTNQMILQNKVADKLREKKIIEINLNQKIKKQKQHAKKIFIYATIITIGISLAASLFIQAELATWGLLIFLLFVVTTIFFRLVFQVISR